MNDNPVLSICLLMNYEATKMLEIYYSCVATNDFIMLSNLLDSELNSRVGGIQNRYEYVLLNKLDNIKDYYIAYDENEAVGCACFKTHSAYSIEIKRVYVKKECRKKGVAKHIFKAIEKDAIKNDYTSMILETGKILHEAMNLYTKLGFKIIPNFEPYKNLKYSICMEKILEKKDETV